MVSPYNEAYTRNRYRRGSNCCVSKDMLTRVNGNSFGDDTKSRKNHYVYNGMRVEPEEVLEQDWVATESGIKDTNSKILFKDQEEKGYRNHRCSKKLD